MAWTRERKKWPWHDFLEEHEIESVNSLERKIAFHKEQLSKAVQEIGPIRNRAIQRAKYAARKADDN